MAGGLVSWGWSLVQISIPKWPWQCSIRKSNYCSNGSRNLGRVFLGVGNSIVVLWRRAIGRICGIEIKAKQRFRALRKMPREFRVSVSKGNGRTSVDLNSKEGSRLEKVGGKSAA